MGLVELIIEGEKILARMRKEIATNPCNLSIEYLSDQWVKWNNKEITGDNFAFEFERQFHQETINAIKRKNKA